MGATLRTLPEAWTVDPVGDGDEYAMATVLASERNINSAFARLLEVNPISGSDLCLSIAPSSTDKSLEVRHLFEIHDIAGLDRLASYMDEI